MPCPSLALVLAVALFQAEPQSTIRGRIHLTEADGSPVATPNGRLVLRSFARLRTTDAAAPPRSDPDRKLDRITVAVDDGAFEFTAPRDAVFTVDRAELDGRAARIVSPSRDLAPPAHGGWRIDADREKLLRLHVAAKGGAQKDGNGSDADHDAELDDVTIAFADANDHGDDPGYVADDQYLLRGAPSPIELAGPPPDEEGRSRDRFWIRARGRAWQLVTVDFADDRDLAVELEPATTLVVELTGAPPPDHAVVRLRQRLATVPFSLILFSKEQRDEFEESFHVADLEIDARPRYVFEPLAARDYVASVEVGPWFESPLQLARAVVSLPRGRTTALKLEVRPPPAAPRRVPFRGTFTFDPAWGPTPPDLRLWPAPAMRGPAPRSEAMVRGSQMKLEDATSGRYAFDFGDVDPGRYSLHITGFGLLHDVEVPIGGATDHAITLGPPCNFLVQLVDASTHAPAEIDELAFGVASGDGAYSFADRHARRGVQPGQFLVTAPAGWIRLEARKRPYSQVEAWWEMTPGVSHETIEVWRACGVTVDFRLEGASYVPDGASVELRAIGPFRLARTRSSSYDEKVFWADASEAGPYELEISAGSAFAPIPTQGVELALGEFKAVTVELKRGR